MSMCIRAADCDFAAETYTVAGELSNGSSVPLSTCWADTKTKTADTKGQRQW